MHSDAARTKEHSAGGQRVHHDGATVQARRTHCKDASYRAFAPAPISHCTAAAARGSRCTVPGDSGCTMTGPRSAGGCRKHPGQELHDHRQCQGPPRTSPAGKTSWTWCACEAGAESYITRGSSARPSQGSRHPEPAGDFAGVTAARCVADAKPRSLRRRPPAAQASAAVGDSDF